MHYPRVSLNHVTLIIIELEVPGTCEGAIGLAMSIMKKNCILLIIAGLMCLQLMT